MGKALLYVLIWSGLAFSAENRFVVHFKYQEDWLKNDKSCSDNSCGEAPKEYIRYLNIKVGTDLQAWTHGGLFVGLNIAKNAKLSADVYDDGKKIDSATVSETFVAPLEIYWKIRYKDLLHYRFGASPALMSYRVNKTGLSDRSDSLFNEETGFGYILSFEVQLKPFRDKNFYPSVGMELYRPFTDFETDNTYKQSSAFRFITYGFTMKF